jgi:CRP/FNR family cyclic AMP-dependent transcriptional regulator
MIEVNAAALATHPFLHGMSCDQLSVLAEAARDVTFPARQRLFEDGGNATRFWLIQSGHVSLDLHVPGEGPVVIETIGMGELLGWSWLFPPYKWAFGAVAATAVEAFEFDAPAVRECCAADPDIGYELNQRVTRVLAKRLQVTRIRLLARSGYGAAVH